jgi:excisionase family DNA binding protein
VTTTDINAAPPQMGALTIAGFCHIYNIGRTHLYEEIKSGRLAARKSGKRSLILRDDAERWARALPTMGTAR